MVNPWCRQLVHKRNDKIINPPRNTNFMLYAVSCKENEGTEHATVRLSFCQDWIIASLH